MITTPTPRSHLISSQTKLFSSPSPSMAAHGPSILLYPYPDSGHIIPLLDLALHFLKRGLAVTVAITADRSHLLEPLVSRHESSVHSVVLPPPERPPTNPPLPRPLFIMTRFRELHYDALLQWLRSQSSPPVAIVSDFFLGWTKDLAAEVGIRRVVFSALGACAYSLNISLARNPPTRTSGSAETLSVPDLPNCPKYPWSHIMGVYRDCKEGEAIRELYIGNWLANLGSDGVVFNSFHQLEHAYMEYLKKVSGHSRVWAVGPVVPAGHVEARGGTTSSADGVLFSWLSAREEESVVYVCFGSRHVLTREQMDTLGTALVDSGVHFIWCVGDKDGGGGGVEEDGTGRGLVIRGWAPQVMILRHRAVGAFLTHCGWNSTLEGVAAGVVLLTWPMGVDQFFNAKLVVEEVGVGVPVGESNVKVPESGELARILKESVNEKSRPERVRAKKLRDAALAATLPGGTSHKDLQALITSWSGRRDQQVLD